MSATRCAMAIGIASVAALPVLGAVVPENNSQSMRQLTDSVYGYSLRVPTGWVPHQRTADGEPLQRQCFLTPNQNLIIVSVSRLPQAVRHDSEFERVGNRHVDPVVAAYLRSLKLPKAMGQQKAKHSDVQSMRFWQGTSTLVGMVISLHAIRYGSTVMVNVVYVAGRSVAEEVRAVDDVMASLSFADRGPGVR